MSHDGGARCLCVAEHRPAPMELVEHHVLPKFMGGLDVEANRVWLCPTAHYNVHEILRMLVARGRLSYTRIDLFQLQPVSRYAYAVALRG